MDTWMKVVSAAFLGVMLIFIWPTAMQWMKNGPKGTKKDWQGAIIPLAAMIGFVILLIMMVKK